MVGTGHTGAHGEDHRNYKQGNNSGPSSPSDDCTTACLLLTQTVAKGNTADRQILIQKDQNTTDNELDNLTEKDLVMKVNTVLRWEGSDKP